MVQGQIFKNCVLKSVDVIKHVNFQFYRAYPAGVIWQNRLLTTDICIHTRSTFYSSKNCSVKNMSSWMFNKFLLIMTFLYKCVKVLSQLYCLVFIKNFKICSWICTKLQIVYKGIFTIHKIHGLSNINILDKWKFISICFFYFFHCLLPLEYVFMYAVRNQISNWVHMLDLITRRSEFIKGMHDKNVV